MILSRKGFDSGYGGVPSPILPDGRMASLPIPSSKGLPARQCRSGGIAMSDLLRDLSGGRIDGDTLLHLDPDLELDSTTRKPGWTPAFGQVGAAQSHLNNQNVGVGDIFLFFGWYRHVEFKNMRWQYVPGEKDFHSLFGWLQIGEVLAIDTLKSHEIPDWLSEHPHVAHKESFSNQRNTIYISASTLSVDNHTKKMPGAGMFRHWTPELKLTAPGQSRSVWNVPRWLEPSGIRPPLTYHGSPGRWHRTGDGLQLQSVAKGQEFIFDSTYYPESLEWVNKLIERHV